MQTPLSTKAVAKICGITPHELSLLARLQVIPSLKLNDADNSARVFNPSDVAEFKEWLESKKSDPGIRLEDAPQAH